MKDHRKIELIVELAETRPNGLWVAGRCAKATIRIGDCFNVVYKYTPANRPEEYAQIGKRINERDVSLRVESIFSYGMSLDEIDAGLTAELTLSGNSETVLSAGDVLGNRD